MSLQRTKINKTLPVGYEPSDDGVLSAQRFVKVQQTLSGLVHKDVKPPTEQEAQQFWNTVRAVLPDQPITTPQEQRAATLAFKKIVQAAQPKGQKDGWLGAGTAGNILGADFKGGDMKPHLEVMAAKLKEAATRQVSVPDKGIADPKAFEAPANKAYPIFGELPAKDIPGRVVNAGYGPKYNVGNIVGANPSSFHAGMKDLYKQMFRFMDNKHVNQYGNLDTVATLAPRYIPDGTQGWKDYLKDKAGIDPHERLSRRNENQMVALAAGVIAKERGGERNPFAEDTLRKAYRDAVREHETQFKLAPVIADGDDKKLKKTAGPITPVPKGPGPG